MKVTLGNGIVDFDIIKPDFTKEMVDKIKIDMKDQAYETQTYEDGITFKETKTRSVFSQKKYYNLVKVSIMERIDNIKVQVISDLRKFVRELVAAYKKELNNKIDVYKAEKNKIAQAKQDAEEIEKIIIKLQKNLNVMQVNLKTVKEIKGGIDGNL